MLGILCCVLPKCKDPWKENPKHTSAQVLRSARASHAPYYYPHLGSMEMLRLKNIERMFVVT
jgi:hypothetical protein